MKSHTWWVGDIDESDNHLAETICPACGDGQVSVFYRVVRIPVHSSLTFDSEKEARSFPAGALALGFCHRCGFVYNTAFDIKAVSHGGAYEDQQGFSPTFRSFATGLAESLVTKYDLRGASVTEIGCGKGDFLEILIEAGMGQAVGIDPLAKPERIRIDDERIQFIPEHLSAHHASHLGRLVACRHTLEHIPDVRRFLCTLRSLIEKRDDVVLFFELPDVGRILSEQAFWDIYYEHCSYFSTGSLARLFRSCRFEILSLTTAYADQYLLIEARPMEGSSTSPHANELTVTETANLVKQYVRSCESRLSVWSERLDRARIEGKRVVVWGGGSKCVSFFTTLGITDQVQDVVDINPNLHGKYIVGACRQIKSPEHLKASRPDIVIVMNEIYLEEIGRMLAGFGLHPKLMAV